MRASVSFRNPARICFLALCLTGCAAPFHHAERPPELSPPGLTQPDVGPSLYPVPPDSGGFSQSFRFDWPLRGSSTVARFWYTGSAHWDCQAIPAGARRCWIRFSKEGPPPFLHVMVGYAGLYSGAAVGAPMRDSGYYDTHGDIVADLCGCDQLCFLAPLKSSWFIRFDR